MLSENWNLKMTTTFNCKSWRFQLGFSKFKPRPPPPRPQELDSPLFCGRGGGGRVANTQYAKLVDWKQEKGFVPLIKKSCLSASIFIVITYANAHRLLMKAFGSEFLPYDSKKCKINFHSKATPFPKICALKNKFRATKHQDIADVGLMSRVWSLGSAPISQLNQAKVRDFNTG